MPVQKLILVNGDTLLVDRAVSDANGNTIVAGVATSTSVGGVKADQATNIDIQPVRIGTDGKLYTKASAELKPSGVSTSAVILAYTEDKGIYVATDTGHWYYWNGSAYADGGVYQATELADGSVTTSKLADETLNYFNSMKDIYLTFTAKQGSFDGQFYIWRLPYKTGTTIWVTKIADTEDNDKIINFVLGDFSNNARLTTNLNVPNVPHKVTIDFDVANAGIYVYSENGSVPRDRTFTFKITTYEPIDETADLPTYNYVNNSGVTYFDFTFPQDGYAQNNIIPFYAKKGTVVHAKIVEDSIKDTGTTNLIFNASGLQQTLLLAWNGTYNNGQVTLDNDYTGLGLYAQYSAGRTIKVAVWINEYDVLGDSNSSFKLITLGDSITALGTGETGWIKYFMEKLNCTLIQNTAVNGATLMNLPDTVLDGNPTWVDGISTNNTLANQVQKILNNNYEAPDLIMIAVGTNAGITNVDENTVYDSYYDSNGSLKSLDSLDLTTSANAFRWCCEKLHTKYPNAVIAWCAPIQAYNTIRNLKNIILWDNNLKMLTEYASCIFIDSNRCGIIGVNEHNGSNGEYLIDGLHPNEAGAKLLGYYNASKISEYFNLINK